MADETKEGNVVSIFPNAPAPQAPTSELDVVQLAETMLDHIKGKKIVAIGWVLITEGGDAVTGFHLSGLHGLQLLGGIGWLGKRVTDKIDE